MKKILVGGFLVISGLSLFNISYGNLDRVCSGTNDRSSIVFRSYVNKDLKLRLRTVNNYENRKIDTCNSANRAKYGGSGKVVGIGNFSNAILNPTERCRKDLRGNYDCKVSCEDFGSFANNIGSSRLGFEQISDTELNGVSKFTISKGDIFSNLPSYIPRISGIFSQNIKTKFLLQAGNILDYTQGPEAFGCFVSKDYGEVTSKCDVTCQDIYKTETYIDLKGKLRTRDVYVRQDSSISCEAPDFSNINTDLINGRCDIVKPKIEVDIDGDDNCIKVGDGYSCYANEDGYNFNLKIKLAGNPSAVNEVRSFVLNETGTSCAGGLPASACPSVDNQLEGSKFSFTNEHFKKVGKYSIEFNGIVRKDGVIINISEPYYLDLKIVPNPYAVSPLGIKGESTSESVFKSTNSKVYSNYEDSYKYLIIMKDKYDNPINFKKIIKVDCVENCVLDESGKKGINISSDELLRLKSRLNRQDGTNYFSVVSAVPTNKGAVKPTFEIKLKKWNPNYIDLDGEETGFNLETNTNKNYSEPIVYNGIEVEGGNLDISKRQKYRIGLRNPGDLSDYKNGKIFDINTNNIKLTNSNYSFENNVFENVNESFGDDIENYFGHESSLASVNKMTFRGTIIALTDEAILGQIGLKVMDLNIRYSLDKDGKIFSIKYPLVKNSNVVGGGSSSSSIGLDSCPARPTTGLSINGILQGKGKVSDTSGINTFSNSSKVELKKEIRKNAYNLTRNLKSGKKINGILFYDLSKESNKNINYSAVEAKLDTNDTLAIKGGNLVIDKNILKQIGIVVFVDNYSVEDNNNFGNIYVKNDVSRINAYIYTDGGFMSGPNDYSDEELRTALNLKGNLVSSNTIGGGEKGDNTCKLPGNKETTNCELAEKYDLNYIRKLILCNPDDYSFKIEYNQDIQRNPPKIFIVK